MEETDITDTVRNIFGREAVAESLEATIEGLRLAATPEGFRNIFGWEKLKEVPPYYATKAKKLVKRTVGFAKGAFRKENLPYAIAEASGFVVAFGTTTILASGWYESGWSHLINAGATVLAKDFSFWLGNILGYKVSHYLLQHEKPYPEKYLLTLVKSNLYATLIETPFQVMMFGGMLSTRHLPVWLSVAGGIFVPGLVATIVRAAKNYRGHIWESTPKYQDAPTQQAATPPAGSPTPQGF